MIDVNLLQPDVLIPWILGMVFGVFVGATPGLTTTMAVALIVPISFHLQPNAGLALIIGVSFTAIFAGDIPAIFMRIPGTPASAAATLDGYALAGQGRGRFALMLDLACSSIGGLFGVSVLIFVAPLLAMFALRFSNYEYFWIGIAGLCISAIVSQSGMLKGLIAAALGMFLSSVGIDIVSGAQRYTFGRFELLGGLEFIPIMIGLFGVSEIFRNLVAGDHKNDRQQRRQQSTSCHQVGSAITSHKRLVLQSSLIGTVVGALPGAGADIAAWVAYGFAKRTSPRSADFGSGSIEGVIAPTSANNAAVAGAWIPALVFGVPGDAVTAIVLGALMMYDIKPGPMIFETSANQVHSIFAIAWITQFFLLLAGYIGIRAFGLILRLPHNVIMSTVMIFSVVGAYALRNSMFDVWVMLIAGVVGLFLESRRVPLAPIVLGLILGPMIEENLRTGLIKSSGSYVPFVSRPLCLVVIIILLVGIVGRPVLSAVLRRRENST